MQKRDYIRKELHNVQKINRENALGPYGQRNSRIPGTLVATLRPAAQRPATRRQLRGSTWMQDLSQAPDQQPGFLPHRWTWPVMPWLTSCTGKGCF